MRPAFERVDKFCSNNFKFTYFLTLLYYTDGTKINCTSNSFPVSFMIEIRDTKEDDTKESLHESACVQTILTVWSNKFLESSLRGSISEVG